MRSRGEKNSKKILFGTEEEKSKADMYLKSLTARGFKSFADKVTLEFEPGISVIVGPNGSGKSNIADAVLWVLGEQSPRNLRGTKMEDVIFAGSATRQPLGMAEVSLSFDNRAGDISIDFPEVVVTRRIFRSGESEYFLNKTPCRLVDIQEILSDLGVGRELTAVIGQNKLEAILRSQAEDRRAFLEEAAGLRKHRRRKEKALRKMEGMERNLVRVRDIVSEVNKQLRPLERQAEHAREYQGLAADIKDLSIRVLVAELQRLKHQWENRREEEARLARELGETSMAVREGKEELSALEAGLRELRRGLDAYRTREMRLLSLGERLRACESLGEERLKLYAALSGDIAYRDGWRSRREELARRRAELKEELARAEVESAGREEEEVHLRGEREKLGGELDRARRERDRLRRAYGELRERGQELHQERRRTAERYDECCAEADRLHSEGKTLAESLEARRREWGEKERETGELEARRGEIERRMEAAREDLARLRGELESIAGRQRRSFQEEALVVARLRALEEVFASHIDYAAAAARVLDEGRGLPGVLGMLMHRINVEEKWEKALESFLGPWLFCVVTRTLEDAVGAIKALKRDEDGYAIFLPLCEVARGPRDKGKDLARETGGTPALEVVGCDAEMRPALEYLLGDVVFCPSLEEAGNMAEAYPRLTFVTEEGDVIAARQAVKGGSLPRSPFHVVARRREMERLQEMRDLCEEESVSLEAQRKNVLAAVAGLEKDLERLGEEGRELQAARRELEMARRELELRCAGEEAEQADVDRKHRAVAEEAEALRERIAALDADAARLEAEKQALGSRLEGEESRVEKLREQQKELEEILQGVRARGASLAERRLHLKERIAELCVEAEGPSPPGREDLAGVVRAQEEMLALVGRLTEAHRMWSARVSEGEEKSRRELEAKEEEREKLRRRLEELEAREGELRELVHNRDLAAAELKMRVDMLVQRLLDEHKVPLETALSDYLPTASVEEMKEELERLERRRERLGEVNLRAVEEHRALKEIGRAHV